MPIYEYRCTSCGHELEVMQKVSDPAPDPCPKCSTAHTMERLVSRTSFQLKGGGWYSDLYGSVKKDSASSTPASSSGASSAAAAPASGGSTSTTPSSGAASSSGSGSGSSGSGSSGSTS